MRSKIVTEFSGTRPGRVTIKRLRNFMIENVIPPLAYLGSTTIPASLDRGPWLNTLPGLAQQAFVFHRPSPLWVGATRKRCWDRKVLSLVAEDLSPGPRVAHATLR